MTNLNSRDIADIVKEFSLNGEVADICEYGSGNINRTYLVKTDEEEYILQEINASVFVRPYVLMRNIENVTSYCREKIRLEGGDVSRETLTVIKTKNGKNLLKTEKGYFRVYRFVPESAVYYQIKDAEMFGSAGRVFGKFARMLADFPIEELDETIPDFHNAKVRYKNFLKDVKRDPCGRVDEVREEIEIIRDNFSVLTQIVDLIEVGEIPTRVIHNDTKIDNILFDKRTDEALCVIDLDTVMPGSILFDFGDAIRSGAATAKEDSTELGKVDINYDYFQSFATEFLRETHDFLTEKEKENLTLSCLALTLELAMRFLDDYINGDTYFRCTHEGHNLERARNQLRLFSKMKESYDVLVGMIQEILLKLENNS